VENRVVLFDVKGNAEKGCDGHSSNDGVRNVLMSKGLIQSNGGGQRVGESPIGGLVGELVMVRTRNGGGSVRASGHDVS